MECVKQQGTLVVGLALFWPFFSFTAFPGLFCLGAVGEHLPVTPLPIDLLQAMGILASALGALRVSGRILGRWLAAVAAAVLVSAAGTALAKGAFALVWASVVVLGAGVFTGMLVIAWARAVGQCERSSLPVILALSYFMSFLVRHAIEGACGLWGAPAGLAHTLIALMPLLSAGVWFGTAERTYSRDDASSVTRGRDWCPMAVKAAFRDPYAQMAVALGLYLVASFFFGFVGNGSDLRTTTWLTKAIAVLLTCAVLLLAWRSVAKGEGSTHLWVVFVGVCVAASYFVAFFGNGAPDLAREIVLPTRVLALFFAWLAACEYASRHCLPCDRAIALLFVPFIMVEFVISALFPGGAIVQMGAAQASVVGFACALPSMLLLLGALVNLVRRVSGGERLPVDETEGGALAAGSERTRREEVCDELAVRYGLTAREKEVLCLLSEGNSQKRIAETLFIAVSSSQTYSKSIYRKMGVHSRQEVIDVVSDCMGQ